MNKIERLSGLWFWLLAIVLMSTESSLLGTLGQSDLIFHTPLCIVTYLGFCRTSKTGTLLFVLLVPFFEGLAGGPLGMYTLGASVVFVSCQLVQNRLGPYWTAGHGLFGILAFVLVYTLWTALLSLLYGDAFKLTLIYQMGGDIFRFSLMIWPIGYLFSWLDTNWGEPVFYEL